MIPVGPYGSEAQISARLGKKRAERYYVEKARNTSSLFPKGEFVESESPDFLIRAGSEIFGIEVTQLFQPAPANAFPEREVESFQEKVTRKAKEMYQKSGSPSLDVLAYFGDKTQADCHSMAKELVNFVENRYRPEEGTTNYASRDTPLGFSWIRIARPLDGITNKWQVGKIGRTVRLERSFLAAEIERKNRLVPQYRKGVSHIWLLLVAEFFPISGSFDVPNEIETWEFSFGFDKVLLFSEEDDKVFELRGA